MKLALIIDDYLPHSTRVGAKMFHELALALSARGNEITVITPAVKQKSKLQIDELDGITVWRFKSGALKDVGKLQRAFNETMLSSRAWKAIRRQLKNVSFDGVIYYSPSIFWGGLVKNLRRKCQCPAYLVLRDMFPQWAIDAGMIQYGSLIDKYFRYFERHSYRQASKIGLMSAKNLEIFTAQHHGYSCEVLHNWAEQSKPERQIENVYSVREDLSLHDKVIFFYGGNIGHAQDMANLMRLARNMAAESDAHFLFVGQGDEVNLINTLAKKWNLTNFSYLPSVDQNTFKLILAEIDIGLFSLSASHTAHNFPGKLLGYMVESVPILGSVNVGNDLLETVNEYEAGFIHVNGEDELLYESAMSLYKDVELRRKLGCNAYHLLEEKFTVDSAAKIIEKKIGEEYASDRTKYH